MLRRPNSQNHPTFFYSSHSITLIVVIEIVVLVNLVDIKVVVLVEIAKQLSCIVVLFLALLQDIRNTGNPPPRTIEFDLLFVEFAVIAVSGNVVRLRRLIQAFQSCLVGVYSAGLKLAIELGWLQLHESGTYVKFTQAGAELFAYHSLSKIGAGF
jgi:hypothetical protein